MHVHNYWWDYVHSEGETVHLNGEKHSPNMESYMLPCFHLILWQGNTSVFFSAVSKLRKLPKSAEHTTIML